jgi:hypothetical protein
MDVFFPFGDVLNMNLLGSESRLFRGDPLTPKGPPASHGWSSLFGHEAGFIQPEKSGINSGYRLQPHLKFSLWSLSRTSTISAPGVFAIVLHLTGDHWLC